MTQSQLSMLRSQMGGQPLIVQAPQTIFQTQSGQNIAIPLSLGNGQQGIYLNPQTIQQSTQQQQTVKEEQH